MIPLIFLIKDIQQSLTNKIEKNQKKATDLCATIETLWERLSVDQEEREMFHMQNRGFAPSTINSVSSLV